MVTLWRLKLRSFKQSTINNIRSFVLSDSIFRTRATSLTYIVLLVSICVHDYTPERIKARFIGWNARAKHEGARCENVLRIWLSNVSWVLSQTFTTWRSIFSGIFWRGWQYVDCRVLNRFIRTHRRMNILLARNNGAGTAITLSIFSWSMKKKFTLFSSLVHCLCLSCTSFIYSLQRGVWMIHVLLVTPACKYISRKLNETKFTSEHITCSVLHPMYVVAVMSHFLTIKISILLMQFSPFRLIFSDQKYSWPNIIFIT